MASNVAIRPASAPLRISLRHSARLPRLANGLLPHSWAGCQSCSRFVGWLMAHPGRRASRPHMAWRSLDRLRRWDGTVTGPCPSFGLAHAVHAGWVAACRQPCAVAPSPPARNKVAGETPAVPGVILEACKRPLAPFPGGVSIMVPVCWVEDAHPGTRASRPHICPAQPWPTAPLGWNGNGALPFILTGQCRSRRQGGCLPATLRYRSISSSQE